MSLQELAKTHPVVGTVAAILLASIGTSGVLATAGYAVRFSETHLLGIDLLSQVTPAELVAEGSRFAAETLLILVEETPSERILYPLIPLGALLFVTKIYGKRRKLKFGAAFERIASSLALTWVLILALLFELAIFDLPLISLRDMLVVTVAERVGSPTDGATHPDAPEEVAPTTTAEGGVGLPTDGATEAEAPHEIAAATQESLQDQPPNCAVAQPPAGLTMLRGRLAQRAGNIWQTFICSRLTGLSGCRLETSESQGYLLELFSANLWLTMLLGTLAVIAVEKRIAPASDPGHLGFAGWVLCALIILDIFLLPVAYTKLYGSGEAPDVAIHYRPEGHDAGPRVILLNGYLLDSSSDRLIFFTGRDPQASAHGSPSLRDDSATESDNGAAPASDLLAGGAASMTFEPGVWSVQKDNVERMRVRKMDDVLEARFQAAKKDECGYD